MTVLDLRVAISKPIWGEYYHWGLDVFNEDEETRWVVEALGEPHQFTASSDDYDPKSLPRSWKSIHVVRLNDVEIEDIQEVVETVSVRNDLAHWNCQNYVIEILNALEEAKVVEITLDYEYIKTALQRMVGPVEDTRNCILAYRAPGEGADDEYNKHEEENAQDKYDKGDNSERRKVLSEEIVVDSDDDEDNKFERLDTSSFFRIGPNNT